MRHRIRLARADEVRRLRAVERAAAGIFREIGLAAVARDDPTPARVLARGAAAGGLLVVDTEDAPAVGFALVRELDGAAYLAEISVHPAFQRNGLGARLIDAAEDWAAERGLPCLVLTTFRDVPWNAPYYRRLGFEPIPDAALGPGLAAQLRSQREAWHALGERLALRRPVRNKHPAA
jgi:GNAT superfamily N-acetyltransferase